jgi:nicotinamidase-related amidase
MSPVLLLADVVPESDAVAAAVEDVLVQARNSGVVVVHIRDNDQRHAHEVLDGEQVVTAPEPDAFTGTALAEVLPSQASLVLVGMWSEDGIRATALAALARGHDVTLVSAAHDEKILERVTQELTAAGGSVVDGVMFGEFAVEDGS